MNQLYNTVSIGRNITDFPQWREMLDRHAHKNLFADASNPVAPGKTWADVCMDCADILSAGKPCDQA